MADFHYIAYGPDGRREAGSIAAPSEEKAWENLVALGLTVVSLSKGLGAGEEKPKPSTTFFAARIPIGGQADLADQLAVLFAAHLPLDEVVRIIAVGAEQPVIRRQFERMARMLADGTPFPDAFSRAGSGFTPLFSSLIRLSHTTANPALLMRRLSTALRRQEKLQAEIGGALIYPVILAMGGIAVFLLMVLYLAPRLEPIFTSVDRPMPKAIGFFLEIRDLLMNHGTFLALGLVVFLGVIGWTINRSPGAVRRIALSLPIWGPILRDTSLARTARTLHLMLAAGIPLAPALAQTAGQLKNEPFAPDFASAATAVESGGTASAAFAETRATPVVFRELFALGERTNALPDIVDTLATLLEDGAERKTQRMTKLITPVLTLVIGGAVGALVYSVMAAILSVNDLAF